MNTLQKDIKYNFTMILSIVAAMVSTVRYDRGRMLPALRSIELVVRKFRRMSSNVCLFRFLLEYSLIGLWAKCLLYSRRC